LTSDKLSIGQLVCSSAGRDKDEKYVVFNIVNDSLVTVVDGDSRKIENPKKKNIKHLRTLQRELGDVTRKLQNGESVTNAEIRKAIKTLGLINNGKSGSHKEGNLT